MTQIMVDPSELRRFAGALEELRLEMLSECRTLDSEIREVRDFWDDKKYREFERRTNSLMEDVVRFASSCESFLLFLKEKAQRADMYLGR